VSNSKDSAPALSVPANPHNFAAGCPPRQVHKAGSERLYL